MKALWRESLVIGIVSHLSHLWEGWGKCLWVQMSQGGGGEPIFALKSCHFLLLVHSNTLNAMQNIPPNTLISVVNGVTYLNLDLADKALNSSEGRGEVENVSAMQDIPAGALITRVNAVPYLNLLEANKLQKIQERRVAERASRRASNTFLETGVGSTSTAAIHKKNVVGKGKVVKPSPRVQARSKPAGTPIGAKHPKKYLSKELVESSEEER